MDQDSFNKVISTRGLYENVQNLMIFPLPDLNATNTKQCPLCH